MKQLFVASKMVPFGIYFATGIVTAWQILQLILWAVWGRPIHRVEEMAFIAAGALTVSSFFALRFPAGSAVAALIACLLLWLFYAPAMRDTLAANPGGETLREMVGMNGESIFVGPLDAARAFAPAIFLTVATIYAAVVTLKTTRMRTQH